MNAVENRFKVATVVAAILFFFALLWGTFQARKNGSLERDLNDEKLKYEAALSEKLQLQKELESRSEQMTALVKKSQSLESALADAEKKKVSPELIARLQRENAAAKKRYAELEAEKKNLEQHLQDVEGSLARTILENQDLNGSLTSLQQANQNLKDELSKAHLAYYDKALIEPVRGKKDKLVAKASRTRKLRATVLVPASLTNVQFKILDPQGNLLSDPGNGMLAVRTLSQGDAITSTSNNGAVSYKELEMIFLPKKKLKPGVYQIEVTSDNLLVGSMKQRLR